MLVQHECTNAALYLKAVNVNLFPSSQVCLRFPSTLVHTASYFHGVTLQRRICQLHIMVNRTNQQCQHFTEFSILADRIHQEVVRAASRGEKAKVKAAVPTLKAAFPLRNSKPLSIANDNH